MNVSNRSQNPSAQTTCSLPLPDSGAAGIPRRQFFRGVGSMLAATSFLSLLETESAGSDRTYQPHHQADAKSCIFLYLEGGPSHIDTFDPKPELDRRHLTSFSKTSKLVAAMDAGERVLVKSPFAFRQVGQSGLWMCEHFQRLADVADELCIYRGCQVDSVDHPTANFQMNTGNRFGGDPGIGAWVSYGLGSENENLPRFIVLPDESYPQGGGANWSNGFLPPAGLTRQEVAEALGFSVATIDNDWAYAKSWLRTRLAADPASES